MPGAPIPRRKFVAALAPPPALPVIDTHIHLFDPTRPQGIPWPPKTNAKLYQPALPARYRKLAEPHGVVGAIKVEASPWLEDNQWVLDVAEKDTIIVGVVGNIEPGKPEFRSNLERFAKNKLFRGIRYGALWGRDFPDSTRRQAVLDDLKFMASAGLSMDTVGSSPRVMADLVRLNDQIPELRIVVDHLPQLNPPAEAAAFKEYENTLRELAKRPQVILKVSAVLRRVDGQVPTDPAFYKARLDQIYGIFGEDRLMFGSDWPNSDNWGSYDQVFAVVREYFASKPLGVREKIFWRNSHRAYRWIHRHPSQPHAG
jgi:predicted TIM-barrel fold metal-dependent hydrolase